jgi:hypothetical protein
VSKSNQITPGAWRCTLSLRSSTSISPPALGAGDLLEVAPGAVGRVVGGHQEGVHLLEGAQAVVGAVVNLDHVEAALDHLDGRQEVDALQAVGIEPVRRVVGGHHEDAAGEQRVEQAAEDHRVGDVRHVELVEAQQAGLAGDAVGHLLQRVGFVLRFLRSFCTSCMKAWKCTRRLR